jgi:hypothetical protein
MPPDHTMLELQDLPEPIVLTPPGRTDMPLDEARREKVLDWLANKCPHFHCPACAACDWGVCGVLDPQGDVPLVCVGCNNCAFVAHFCAVMLGVA